MRGTVPSACSVFSQVVVHPKNKVALDSKKTSVTIPRGSVGWGEVETGLRVCVQVLVRVSL